MAKETFTLFETRLRRVNDQITGPLGYLGMNGNPRIVTAISSRGHNEVRLYGVQDKGMRAGQLTLDSGNAFYKVFTEHYAKDSTIPVDDASWVAYVKGWSGSYSMHAARPKLRDVEVTALQPGKAYRILNPDNVEEDANRYQYMLPLTDGRIITTARNAPLLTLAADAAIRLYGGSRALIYEITPAR